jgi:Uma2 family endonuclease
MSTQTSILTKPAVVYPESDGLPLSDNTKQFRLIMTIQGGLAAQYLDEPNVFVAGNLLWYPVEGDNKTRAAPDIFVAFGRPKGDRGSYQQWLEGNIAPQTVFEIVSPSNRAGILTAKFSFYDEFGVEEYYLYDPDDNSLDGWLRKRNRLTKIRRMAGWVSPLLGIKFLLDGGELTIIGKNGQPFVATPEAIRQRDEALEATKEALQQAEKFRAQLKALGVDPEA